MVRALRFSKFLLLLLCAVAFNQGLITYGAHASKVFRVSPNTSATECSAPRAADFSNQQIAPSTSNVLLPGHLVQPVKQGEARLIGPLNPALQLRVELVFKIRNEAPFQNCLASINNPSSPEYRRFLNITTLQPFLPTPGQKASVFNLLTQEGLTVTDGASPLVLNIKGSAQTIMAAFAVRLSVYSYRNSTFFATGSDPEMPSNLAPLVNGILGLDNYTKAMPAESPCTGPYCPQGIQIGYSISALISSGDTGSGQTVAVVDLPGDPNSQTAIDKFDTQYGLAATILTIVYPDGTPTSWDPGWASEAAMDIEAVHSVAPGATIVLAYDTSDPMNGVDYVTSNGLASVISNSWTYWCGFPCSDTQLPSILVSSVDSRLATDAAQGVTILFASGDNGRKPDGSTLGTEFPASDPNVLGVGATNLALTGCGITMCTGYGSERGASISGGGYSGYFSEPSWQTSTIGSTGGTTGCTTGPNHPSCRAVPDISMFGYLPYFWVYSTVNGWGGNAGTSLSTPLWAGFIGLALQVKGGGQFGNIAPLLYSLGAGSSYSTLFHDVTTGSNGYSAGTGWDPVTGWGSPIANTLADALSGTSMQTLTTSVASGSNTGSVSPNCPSGCSEIVGLPISISATAAAGYSFSSWFVTGDSCSSGSTNNPCTFTMPNNAVTVSASFISNIVTMTVSYSLVGGGDPTRPAFQYVLNGASKSLKLSKTATAVSVDAGSAWSVSRNPLGGSTTFQQWYSNQPLTGAASSSTTTVFVFYRQTLQTLSYSVSGGGSGYAPPTFQASQFGSSTSIGLTNTATGYWYDYDSSWTVAPNPLTGSGSSERWFTTKTTSGTIGASTTRAFSYQHQFYLTMQMTPSGAGSTNPSSGWYNAGQTVTIKATANTGHKFVSWIGTGTGSYTGSSKSTTITMNSAITETANFS